MISINIVGTGNVAWHLARAFGSQNEVVLMQVAGRSQDGLLEFRDFARELVSIKDLTPADVTIIAVSDDAIKEVYDLIPFKNELVVHTSGFTGMLSRKQNKNDTGVFYPLQSFSKKDLEITFQNIPILIEAENDENEKTLRLLADVISEHIEVLNSAQRRQLHLAAVFANNFTNHCYTIAKEICDENNVPFVTLHPLLLKTAQKAIEYGPDHSQTGPAIRNDSDVLETQANLLQNATQKAVYATITTAIKETYGKEL